MAKQLKLRRGTTAQHSTFTGAEGEVTVDTTKDTLVVHDGVTPGGKPLLSAANGAVGTTNIADNAVTTAKIAAGAVVQAGLATNVAGNGPAFSAYRATSQSISSSTWTKVQCATEEFDTNSNYDKDTNYRFAPTVAGYYQVSGTIDSSASAAYTVGGVSIYKNGAIFKRGSFSNVGIQSTVSSLVYLNGSTDYVELYAYITGTSVNIGGGQASTFFQAAMIRSA